VVQFVEQEGVIGPNLVWVTIVDRLGGGIELDCQFDYVTDRVIGRRSEGGDRL